MTEELPPLVFLDMAAKAAGYTNWHNAHDYADSDAHRSIIAHARTLERLAKHEPDIVPVDEDEEALVRFLVNGMGWSERLLVDWRGLTCWPEALAQFKAELAGRK